MLRTIFFILLFNFLLLAQAVEKKLTYVPGEIIIKYEKYGSKSKGNEILNEHDYVIKKMNTLLPAMGIKSYKPVFNRIIMGMVNENLTEKELNEREDIKNGLTKSSSNYKQTEFSTILLLRTGKNDKELIELIKELNNNHNMFEDDGFKLVFAEPNYIKKITAGDPDPFYYDQWSHLITNIEQAWNISQGSPQVKIAIIDTGVDPEHPDLISNLTSGYDFVDIDTNAYKQANYTTIPGEDYTGTDQNFTDYNGHGTHCAGIAAAIGDNGIGVKGVAPGCKIFPIRAGFSIKQGNTEYGLLETTSIVSAIRYAADNGADVISMSFGGSYSQLEQEAIDYAFYKNVVLIAAAGNSASSVKQYPAAYDNVIAVTSIDKNKTVSSFSNFGYWTDIAAPGQDIISTVPISGGANTDSTGYLKLSGTSMAVPYIAGTAALILSQFPGISNELVYNTINSSVDPYVNTGIYLGTGFINVYESLSEEEACVAKISVPNELNNICINDNIEISGKAYGTNFSKYIFEYRNYLDEFSNWQAAGSYNTVSVDSGYLGDIHFLQEGIYYIRLRVVSQNNKEYTDIIGPITFDRRLKANWPVSTGYESVSSPAVSDIDNDGTMEAVFTNSKGAIYVVDAAGNNKSGWPIFLTNQYGVQTVAGYSNPAVGDIDNDGKEEIVVRDGQNLFVFDYKGVLKSGWPKEMGWLSTGNAMFSSPVLFDINGDGKKEIIVTHRGIAGVDGKILIFDNLGNDLPGWPVFLLSRRTLSSTPVVCDLDGDNDFEIIVQCYDGIDNIRTGYLYVFNSSGNILPGWPKELGTGAWNSPIVADINNDGESEIVMCSHIGGYNLAGKIGVYVINKQGTILEGWPVELNYQQYGYYNITAGMSAGDINNDGYKEILVASSGYNYSLWALNRNAEIMWSVSSKNFEYVESSSPLIADINGDEKPEIIVSKIQNAPYTAGKILVVDNSGNINNELSRVVPEQLRASPSIGDFDKDGLLELICTSQKGNIFCWDYDAAYDESKLIWPTYQKSNDRNGTFILEPVPPSITNLIEPLNNVINLSSKVTFKWNPAEGALKYELQLSEGESFENIFYKDSAVSEIQFEVDSLENGKQYFWRVRANNKFGNGSWSEVRSFSTIVSAPEKVLLASPNNNSEGLSTSINLKWMQAARAERYWVQVSRDGNFTNTIINDTSITDTSKQINNLLNITRYYWRVRAVNAGGVGAWSETWYLTTIKPLPDVPVLVYPLNNSVDVDTVLHLKWNKLQFGDSYKLLLSFDNLFANIVIVDSVVTDTLKEVNGLQEGVKYYWKINSKNTTGDGSYSNVWNFTTLLKAPDSLYASVLNDSGIKITWKDNSANESGYKIERKDNDEFILRDSVEANTTTFIDTVGSISGTLQYRVFAYTNDAVSNYSNESSTIIVSTREYNGIPDEYSLLQNYPNPFNPSTKIEYHLPERSFVKLEVYDILGRVVSTIVNENKDAGIYSVVFNAVNLSSGIYFYQITAGDFQSIRKMLLVK